MLWPDGNKLRRLVLVSVVASLAYLALNATPAVGQPVVVNRPDEIRDKEAFPAVLEAPAVAELHLRPVSALPLSVLPPSPVSGNRHAFWDRNNRVLFAGVGLMRALDYASTRNMQARGREEILLPDDVVNNPAGFAALEAAGTATSIGVSYLMHRTGHHNIERWVSLVHIGVAGFGTARNYALKSKHPAPVP
jgi:hypothetical protein